MIPISGMMNLSHLSYDTSTIANVARISPDGVMNEISPCPNTYAEMIASLGIPTVSARGAMIGIESTASPEDEEMKNPSTMKITNITRIKITGLIP